MDITDPPNQRTRSFLSRVAHLTQWVVFALLAMFAIAVATEVRKASVPDAPVSLLYITVAATILLAVAHAPPIFTRLPRRINWAAYGAIVAVVMLFGVYLGQMKPAWERTPQGAEEAAERTKADQEAAREKAVEDARVRAEQVAAAETAAAEKTASVEAQGQALCESLQENVVEMSKSNFVQVLEINNIMLEPPSEPTKELSCSGTAVVSRGDDRRIDFGVRTTPQGKQMVTMELN